MKCKACTIMSWVCWFIGFVPLFILFDYKTRTPFEILAAIIGVVFIYLSGSFDVSEEYA